VVVLDVERLEKKLLRPRREREGVNDTRNDRGLSVHNQVTFACVKSQEDCATRDRSLINLHLQAGMICKQIDLAICCGCDEFADELEEEYTTIRNLMEAERLKKSESVTEIFDKESKRARIDEGPVRAPGNSVPSVPSVPTLTISVPTNTVASATSVESSVPEGTTSEEAGTVESGLTNE